MENCVKCGKPLLQGANFCGYCGTPIAKEPAQKRYCVECGTELQPDLLFCPNCGCKAAIDQENNEASAGRVIESGNGRSSETGAMSETFVVSERNHAQVNDNATDSIVTPEESPERVNMEDKVTSDENSLYIQAEDVFAITGRGTVVIGNILRGNLQVGQMLAWSHDQIQKSAEVEGINVGRQLIDRVEAGSSCGILLKNVSKREVHRGDILTDFPMKET